MMGFPIFTTYIFTSIYRRVLLEQSRFGLSLGLDLTKAFEILSSLVGDVLGRHMNVSP